MKVKKNTSISLRNPLTIYAILVATLFLLPTFAFADQFKITKVYNGNTVKAVGREIEIEVRLVGIDTPEISKKKREPGQPFNQEAKDFLARLVLNKTVDIRGYGPGSNNRMLVVIYLEGKNINLEMVKAGLAEVYRGIAPHKFPLLPYWQMEKEARDDKRGMWSLGNKYVSPKDWRKMNRWNDFNIP